MSNTSSGFGSPDHLRALEPYVPGLLVSEVSARFGIPVESVVKLASAENPLGTSARVKEAIGASLGDLHLYPDWRAQQLREAIAGHHGIRPEQVVVGAGETELIPLIIRTFSREGDEVLFPIPTFPIYEQAAVVDRRAPRMVAMDESLEVDPERLLAAITPRTRILILTSPNNPLSKIVGRDTLELVLERTPSEVLVLLDEAYVDYSEHGSQMDLLSRHERLVVLRTFSKVYGLAGLRVGYAAAHAGVAQALMKAKPTWNMGCVAVSGALAALADRDHYEKTRALVREEREYLLGRLAEFSDVSVVMTPEANFVCLRILDPKLTSTVLFERLLRGGVITKDCSVSYRGLGDRFLRVDVSLRRKLDVFLERFAAVCR